MVENDFYVKEYNMTLEEVKAALKKYARKYGMASEVFYEKMEAASIYAKYKKQFLLTRYLFSTNR